MMFHEVLSEVYAANPGEGSGFAILSKELLKLTAPFAFS